MCTEVTISNGSHARVGAFRWAILDRRSTKAIFVVPDCMGFGFVHDLSSTLAVDERSVAKESHNVNGINLDMAFSSVLSKQVTGIKLMADIIDLSMDAVGDNQISASFEFLQVIKHWAVHVFTDLNGRLVYDHCNTLG